ncbi:MAG: hypothetical protein ACU0A5_21775 [Salipiger marinus]|uniref:hypothetical protein n=1 Tax=Salipiger marinus TaxID=555512 RepID=UPI0040597E50
MDMDDGSLPDMSTEGFLERIEKKLDDLTYAFEDFSSEGGGYSIGGEQRVSLKTVHGQLSQLTATASCISAELEEMRKALIAAKIMPK